MGLFDQPSSGEEAAGSAIGSAIGNALPIPVPVVGSVIGSQLGKILGGLFGSKPKRVTLGFGLNPHNAEGKFTVTNASTKGDSVQNAQLFGDTISGYLNQYVDTAGLKFNDGISVQTNIGDKDPGTWIDGKKVSGGAADSEAAIKEILYGKNDKGNRYFKIVDQSKYDSFFNSAGTTATNSTNNEVTSSDNNSNLVTIQDANDPLERLNSAKISGVSNFALIGLAILSIIILTKGK